MTGQTQAAIAEADALLFVIDARAGVTTGDEIIATALHRAGKPVILAANKCEGRIEPAALADVFALGFGEPTQAFRRTYSGHGRAWRRRWSRWRPRAVDEENGDEDFADAADETEDAGFRLPRPSRCAWRWWGGPMSASPACSTSLLGEERSITGPEAGLTRDAITAPWKIGDRDVLLHDTAGLRKKARVAGETLEEMSVASTLEAIRFADCVIVMIDATAPFEKQDLTIADLIAREGRAIVFAVNKWDLMDNKAGAISRMREKLDRLLPQVAGAPLVAISARTGEGLDRLAGRHPDSRHAPGTRRVPTATLNRFLESALQRHAPPAISGRRVRIRYMTQRKARPPTFALFGNQLDALPEAYQRYLQNGLRETFDLKGTPLRLVMRNTKNPYDPKK